MALPPDWWCDSCAGAEECVSFDASTGPDGPATAMSEGVILHEGKVIQRLKGGWWWEKNLCDPTKRIY